MSQVKDLSLNNGTAAVVFTVTSAQSGSDTPASWKNGNSAISATRITALERRIKGSPRSKTSLRVVMPVTRTVEGIEELVDVATVVVEFTKPDILTAAKRKELRSITANLIGNADIIDMIDNDSPAY